MKCKYFDCGWCYAPIDVVTSASSSSSCIYPEHCPYLKTEMTKPTDADNAALFGKDLRVYSKKEMETKKMDNVESIEAEIKMLQSKLEFYKELEKTQPSPVEEAYKKVFGYYPQTDVGDGYWEYFQNGYKQAQKDYKVGEYQEPVKQKDTLYDLLGDFLQYSDHKETVCKIVRDWLDQNTTIVEEDYSTVTLKLKKGAFGDAN